MDTGIHCKTCGSSVKCSECARNERSNVTSVVKRFYDDRFRTKDVQNHAASSLSGGRMSTALVWQQAIVQDGLF